MRGVFVERMKKRQKYHRANDKAENVKKKTKQFKRVLKHRNKLVEKKRSDRRFHDYQGCAMCSI